MNELEANEVAAMGGSTINNEIKNIGTPEFFKQISSQPKQSI